MTANELFAIFGAAATIVGGAWGLVKVVVAQFERRLDERFVSMEQSREAGRKLWDEQFRRMERRQGELERDLSGLLVALPVNYTRREDAIRSDVQVNAKLDAINQRLDQWMNQWTREGRT